jgi:hypothetical protein
MKLFNAFQSVSFFAAAPFGLSWLSEQSFRGSGIAFWVGVLVYFVAFCLNVAAVRVAIDELDW